MRSLTGARVVLEGAHTVSVGRERAHALAGVCQPALDRPVGAARVHVPVYQLRGRGGGGGRVGTRHSGPAQKPLQTSLCKRGGARAGLSGETVGEPEMPLPGGPTRSPTLVPEVMLPTPTSSAGQWGSGRLAGIRQTWLQSLTGPWPFAKSLTTLSRFTHSEDHASPFLVGLRPSYTALSTLTAGARMPAAAAAITTRGFSSAVSY